MSKPLHCNDLTLRVVDLIDTRNAQVLALALLLLLHGVIREREDT
jgi:hypothetical protein